MASTHIEENRKHIDQNQDCPLIAGTLSCLQVTWVSEDGEPLVDTPCQHCKWWDDFCDEVEEEDAWIPLYPEGPIGGDES